MESFISAVEQLHLYHLGHLKWREEYDKLLSNVHPYDCEDDEALKRFDTVLTAFDKRQKLRITNRARAENLA